jgi:hypothetical protein
VEISWIHDVASIFAASSQGQIAGTEALSIIISFEVVLEVVVLMGQGWGVAVAAVEVAARSCS